MGNKTAIPKNSHASVYPIIPTNHRTSVTNFDPDVPSTPLRSPTFPVSSNSPIYTPPINSTIGNLYNIPLMPTTSPTFAFPVHSPTAAEIPRESPAVDISMKSPTFDIPIVPSRTGVPSHSPTSKMFTVSPIPRTPIVSPSTAISANSPSSRVPLSSPIPVVSTVLPSTVVSTSSHTSKVPINSSTARVHVAPQISPITNVLMNSPMAAPVASSSPDIRMPSPIANLNGYDVISPDTSAVSPTLDLDNTPISSPIPPKAVVPVKPITFSNKNRSIARITHDASTSPMVRVVSKPIVLSTTSRPHEAIYKPTVPKAPVPILKKPILKPPMPPPPSILKQTKHSTLSSADRSSKWYQFEQKQQEEQKKFAETIPPPPSPSTRSPTKSPVLSPTISTPEVEIIPTFPDIIAVPSFSLRATAVYNPFQDPPLLSERTQSIHTDISIFKYYLTYNEAKHSIGDHTKATMFKMDTLLKKTPLPAPSLSFLTKNFNDGTEGIKYHSESTPSFEVLGLQDDLEDNPADQSPKEPRLHEKQQQRKLRQPLWHADETSDSNNSLQFVQSTVFNQADFPGLIQTSTANYDPPLSSILKKPVIQQKTDFDANAINNSPSTVSFTLPSTSSRTKANQSISRSVRLTHRKTYQ